MTALGVAVAIPAVLAYNAFYRCNRVWLSPGWMRLRTTCMR